jgi:hypothetical protein
MALSNATRREDKRPLCSDRLEEALSMLFRFNCARQYAKELAGSGSCEFLPVHLVDIEVVSLPQALGSAFRGKFRTRTDSQAGPVL